MDKPAEECWSEIFEDPDKWYLFDDEAEVYPRGIVFDPEEWKEIIGVKNDD